MEVRTSGNEDEGELGVQWGDLAVTKSMREKRTAKGDHANGLGEVMLDRLISHEQHFFLTLKAHDSHGKSHANHEKHSIPVCGR